MLFCSIDSLDGPRREINGIEMTFAQNVASRFLITQSLLPILQNNATVLNCLGAGNGGDVDLTDIQLQKNFSFIRAASQYASINDLLAMVFYV